MLHLIADMIILIGVFIAGIAAGTSGSPTVTKAIASLKKAEQSAKATLDEITAHKAS